MNYLSTTIKNILLSSLIMTPIVSYASTKSNEIKLTTIKDNTLTICTTEDYLPLTSFNSNENKFEVLAPIVADKFAKHVNLNLSFIRTTWKEMSNDLKARKCDIAWEG